MKTITVTPSTLKAIREWVEETPEDRYGEEEKDFEQGDETIYVTKSYEASDEDILVTVDSHSDYCETYHVLDKAEVTGVEAYSGEDIAKVSNEEEIMNIKIQ